MRRLLLLAALKRRLLGLGRRCPAALFLAWALGGVAFFYFWAPGGGGGGGFSGRCTDEQSHRILARLVGAPPTHPGPRLLQPARKPQARGSAVASQVLGLRALALALADVFLEIGLLQPLRIRNSLSHIDFFPESIAAIPCPPI